MAITTKRAYEKPEPRDGYRILIDGIWPRGMSKENLKISAWMRPIAPSVELRNWYGHKPEKWEQFRKRYHLELGKSPRKDLVEELVRRAREGKVTLVFGARDAARSNAAALAELIDQKLRA
jgi:uncharacterized protein YeaO (DUF488 family)